MLRVYITCINNVYCNIRTLRYNTGPRPGREHLREEVAVLFRTILDVPKPRYGGAPNLCEDIYQTRFPSLLKRVPLETFRFCAGNRGFTKEDSSVY